MDLVVRQPRAALPGETMFGTRFTTGPGGKGLNQAVAAARAGADVRFLGAVGGDPFGDRLRQRLREDGVGVERLRTVDAETGIAAITVTDDGENSIVVVPGANADESFAAGDRALISAASHLVVQLERPVGLVERAMTFARSRGVRNVLTPAPARDGIEPLLELADIVVPNEGEATLLSGERDAVRAARMLSRRGATIIVTRGARGAVVAREGEILHEVAAPPVAAVDTTGAGDTFTGALVAWLSQGATLADALRAAVVAAAIGVTRPGAAESAPTRGEISAGLG